MADAASVPHDYRPSTMHMGDCEICGNPQVHPLHVPVPDHLGPYVATIGIDHSLALFLAAGGSQIYLARRSGKRTLAAKTIGPDQVERLAGTLGYGYIKVPLARQWIAEVLRAQGKSDNEIARIVRADVATVRRWLGPKSPGQQLSLPLL